MNPDRIQHLLGRARKARLLVIGDVMLDEFVWGKVSRISPEAPVPVVEVQSETSYPGGAANVARNLRPFCEDVRIAGLVGNDDAARKLRGLLREEGIACDGLLAAPDFSTIVKTRIVARQQQVVRVDREQRRPVAPEAIQEATRRIKAILPDLDAIIFEDYGKGFLGQAFVDHVAGLAIEGGLIVTADPNPGNPIRWNAAMCVKPNRAEAFALAGRPDPGATDDPLTDAPLLDVGNALRTSLGIESLLITLGEHGMILLSSEAAPYHTPTRAQEVFDVSGAGDTAIALFTLALTAGATLPEAAEISNHASGVVVGKLGTATLTPDELVGSFENNGD